VTSGPARRAGPASHYSQTISERDEGEVMNETVKTRPQDQPISDEDRERVWTQTALQWRFGMKYAWKPVDKEKCFECQDYKGIFKVRNNTHGHPYESHIWKGQFLVTDEERVESEKKGLLKPKRPQRGLLEIQVRDWESAELDLLPETLAGRIWKIRADDDSNIVKFEEDKLAEFM